MKNPSMKRAIVAGGLALFFAPDAAWPESVADCPKEAPSVEKRLCGDPTFGALDKEVTHLAELARQDAHMTPARRKDLAASQASFLKTLRACGDARPCLARAYIAHIHGLRKDFAGARAKDAEGISHGPLVASCPGFDALIDVTFVDSEPAFAFLQWRDKSVVLTKAPAASGARYAGTFGTGDARFWNKGNEATVDLPGKQTLTCALKEAG